MIAALERLRSTMNCALEDDRAPSMATMKISHRSPTGFMALFASHPPLEARIAALRKG
jgi:Zn-dependent protease with chaperone function